MYYKIRITVASLVVMAVCLLTSVGTLSYFTDTTSMVNTFTVGSVATQLAMYSDDSGTTPFDINGVGPLTSNLSTGDSDVNLFMQATNTGNVPVYQRFRVVIPKALANMVTLKLPPMTDECKIDTTFENAPEGTPEESLESECSNENYTVKYKPAVIVDNEAKYAEYYITSKAVLDVNAVTAKWPALGFSFNGVSEANKDMFVCENNDSNKCVLGISIYSDAIQTVGFANDAVNAFADLAETYD